jgi:transcriptional regulator with XRE-family HTH domain
VYAHLMKHESLRNLIRRRTAAYATQLEAAKEFGISPQYLSEVVREKQPKPITDEIARKFGYTMKEREFEKVKEE